MPLTNDGAVAIASALLGDGGVTLFDNANAQIAVGDDSTAFSTSQSQLQAEANGGNHLRKGMNTGYPLRNPDSDGSLNKTRYQTTFGTSEGNFRWEEWGITNSATVGGGEMLFRIVEFNGEKSSSATWVFEVDLLSLAG